MKKKKKNVQDYDVITHLKLEGIFDVPQGRHDRIIEDFYIKQGQNGSDSTALKHQYILTNLIAFNEYLKGEEVFTSHRLNAEKQAELEPKRIEEAIASLKEKGIDATVLNGNEINFLYMGSTIKYFPYSGWASGKTIKDGRGLHNLLRQLEPQV